MFNRTNPSARAKKNTIVNDAGYKTYALPDCQALFGEGLSFSPKNSFYRSNEERLRSMEVLIQNNIKKDPTFTAACAHYMGATMGRRLVPTMIVSHLALDGNNDALVTKVVNDVFTRPDFYANCLAYIKDLTRSKSIGAIPKGLYQILRNKFETLEPHTLIAQKMLRRRIKLKDLIKVLRPKTYPMLYKSIIEDGPESKLKVVVKENGKIVASKMTTLKAEAGKEDSTITKEQVQTTISENIGKWPINELIRNLSSLQGKDAGKLLTRFNNYFSDPRAARFVNPFDLIPFGSHNISSEIVEVLDYVIGRFFNYTMECKRPLIMMDTSGSMCGDPYKLAAKYMVLLRNVLKDNDFEFWGFNNNEHDMTGFVRNYIDSAPLYFGNKLLTEFQRHSGSTALFHSLENVLKKREPFDGLIIITDEQTWDEENEIKTYRDILPKYGLNGRAMVINVAQTKNTVFKPNSDVYRLYGEEGKVIDIARALFGWNTFKQEMIDHFIS